MDQRLEVEAGTNLGGTQILFRRNFAGGTCPGMPPSPPPLLMYTHINSQSTDVNTREMWSMAAKTRTVVAAAAAKALREDLI
ncbi:unnamed protein product [Cuscuta campestris]|uniref:Uncharacterized protein n=1 Tax=Cuscuta campestris TaxID=132261 RepID=A0A484LNF7_9ASTE|nr:unnamed protein product [Cuscuta campestris]